MLACKYVDEVIIGAPFILTRDLVTTLNIQQVVAFDTQEDCVLPVHAEVDPYAVAKELGIFSLMPKVENDLTLEAIAERVLAQKNDFLMKVAKKSNSEREYYSKKTHIVEVGDSPIMHK